MGFAYVYICIRSAQTKLSIASGKAAVMDRATSAIASGKEDDLDQPQLAVAGGETPRKRPRHQRHRSALVRDS